MARIVVASRDQGMMLESRDEFPKVNHTYLAVELIPSVHVNREAAGEDFVPHGRVLGHDNK